MAKRGQESQYPTYLAKIPVNRRDEVLDEDHNGVDTHLNLLAARMTNWEGILGAELGLSDVDISDIRTVNRNDPSLGRIAALQMWKRKKGIDATYSVLLKAFLRADRADLARALCKLFKEELSSAQPPPPQRDTGAAGNGTVSLLELLEEVGIPEDSLNRRCTDDHLHSIAEKIHPSDWGTYATALGLSNEFIEDLREDLTRARDQRYNGLIMWKQHQAFKAKYRVLVELFLKKDNALLAESVCELLL